MTITHFDLVVTGLAGAITAVILAARNVKKSVVKPLLRLVETVREIAEVVLGKDAVVRHGVEIEPRVPSITERVDRVDEGQLHMIGQLGSFDGRLAVVESELRADHGQSIKDQINTIAQVVTAAPQGGSQ